MNRKCQFDLTNELGGTVAEEILEVLSPGFDQIHLSW